MEVNIQIFQINQNQNLRQALHRLNNINGGHHRQVLFVYDENNKIVGALTDGDTRRALISGKELDTLVENVMFRNFRFFKEGQSNLIPLIKELKQNDIFILPIINKNDELVSVIDLKQTRTILPIEAVLMAGGEGKRLLPLTENTPKPLLKVGNKPIISYNIERLLAFGVKNFHFTLNYLGNQIEQFVHQDFRDNITPNFIYEKEKLGTAGSVALISNFVENTILVMNSDLLTTIDFEAFFLFFKSQRADMAVATIPYNVKIPYAILEVEDSKISALKEKPTFNYYSNAGIYLIKKEVIDLIPKNQFYDATDLMETVIKEKRKLVSFPIRHYWLDIGNPIDFERANEDVKYLRLN